MGVWLGSAQGVRRASGAGDVFQRLLSPSSPLPPAPVRKRGVPHTHPPRHGRNFDVLGTWHLGTGDAGHPSKGSCTLQASGRASLGPLVRTERGVQMTERRSSVRAPWQRAVCMADELRCTGPSRCAGFRSRAGPGLVRMGKWAQRGEPRSGPPSESSARSSAPGCFSLQLQSPPAARGCF